MKKVLIVAAFTLTLFACNAVKVVSNKIQTFAEKHCTESNVTYDKFTQVYTLRMACDSVLKFAFIEKNFKKANLCIDLKSGGVYANIQSTDSALLKYQKYFGTAKKK